MRSITIAGREYPLRFTLRVVKACTERYGSLEGLFDTTQQKDGLQALDESLWLLEAMLDGQRSGIGVGVAKGGDGWYCVQWFLREGYSVTWVDEPILTSP